MGVSGDFGIGKPCIFKFMSVNLPQSYGSRTSLSLENPSIFWMYYFL